MNDLIVFFVGLFCGLGAAYLSIHPGSTATSNTAEKDIDGKIGNLDQVIKDLETKKLEVPRRPATLSSTEKAQLWQKRFNGDNQ